MYSEPVFDKKTSAAIARKIDRKFKDCWPRSLIAMRYLPADALYVEGWVVVAQTNQIIEHAWCQTDDRIIDVTLDENQGNFKYFPGICYPRVQLLELGCQPFKGDKVPLFRHSEEYGLIFGIYQSALKSAHQYLAGFQNGDNKPYGARELLPV